MRFLLSILALLAVLLAPAGMLGSHAAMAMAPAASASGHHDQQQHEQGGDRDQSMIDCAIACTALPSHQPLVADTELLAGPAPDAPPSLILYGIQPEAATPPPRFS